MVAGLCKVWEERWRKGRWGDWGEWEKGEEGKGEGEGSSFILPQEKQTNLAYF